MGDRRPTNYGKECYRVHPNTKLSSYTRGRMIWEHGQGIPAGTIARTYGISRTNFYRWRRRFLAQGDPGLDNRTSRPRHILYGLTQQQVDMTVRLRQEKRWGPARLSPAVKAPSATVYRCLRRLGIHRLPKPCRMPVVRYEASVPGELGHLDVLHLFALKGGKPVFQFTLVDDYTRMAYALIAPRRTTQAALDTVRLAQISFGFPFQRILTDKDVTFAWTPRPGWRWSPPEGGTRFTRTLQTWGIRHSVTRVRRPQTNGKVERFHRTIREELYRAHALFTSEEEREKALSSYLSFYNSGRSHTALGGLTPVQRRDLYFKQGAV